jgi:hypothetical protein
MQRRPKRNAMEGLAAGEAGGQGVVPCENGVPACRQFGEDGIGFREHAGMIAEGCDINANMRELYTRDVYKSRMFGAL